VLADKYGPEAVRHYLSVGITTGRDSDFNEEMLISFYNTNLANSLGNLVNRVISMTGRYRQGILRRGPREGAYVTTWQPLFDKHRESYMQAMDRFEPNHALLEVGLFSSACNGFIESMSPWGIAKHPELADELDALLYVLADGLRFIAILLSPVLPKAAHGIFDQLKWKMDLSGQDKRFRLADAAWGGLPDGHQLGQPTPLFPRIEVPKE
jgi:methionyl-tRNA synthetase